MRVLGRHQHSPAMQLLIDLFPVLAFFAVFKVYGIYAATATIMVVMTIQVAVQWLRERKVNNMLLVSTILVLLFGGATLALRDPIFIQWKPTIVNWLFAAAFLGSRLFGKKTMAERIMGEAVELNAAFWRQLNMMWVVNFFVLGAANIYVVYNFDEATWVNFKLYGILGLTLVMALGQAIWISAHLANQDKERQER